MDINTSKQVCLVQCFMLAIVRLFSMYFRLQQTNEYIEDSGSHISHVWKELQTEKGKIRTYPLVLGWS